MSKRKILSLLLVFSLCLSLVPTWALATDISAGKSWVTALSSGGQEATVYPELNAAPSTLVKSGENSFNQIVYVTTPVAKAGGQSAFGVNTSEYDTDYAVGLSVNAPAEYIYTKNGVTMVDYVAVDSNTGARVVAGTASPVAAASAFTYVYGVADNTDGNIVPITWLPHTADDDSTASSAKAEATDYYLVYVAKTNPYVTVDPDLADKLTIGAPTGGSAKLLADGLSYGLTAGIYSIPVTAAEGYTIKTLAVKDGNAEVGTPAIDASKATGTISSVNVAAQKGYVVTGTVEEAGYATIGLDDSLKALTGIDYQVSIHSADSWSKLTKLTAGVEYDVRLTVADANKNAYAGTFTFSVKNTTSGASVSAEVSEWESSNPSTTKESATVEAAKNATYVISATGIEKTGVQMTVNNSTPAEANLQMVTAPAASATPTDYTYSLKKNGTAVAGGVTSVSVATGDVLTITPYLPSTHTIKSVTYGTTYGVPDENGNWVLKVPATGNGTLTVVSDTLAYVIYDGGTDFASHDMSVMEAYTMQGKVAVPVVSDDASHKVGTPVPEGTDLYLVVKSKAGVTPNLSTNDATVTASIAAAANADAIAAITALHEDWFPEEADEDATETYSLYKLTTAPDLVIINGGAYTVGTVGAQVTLADTTADAGLIRVYYGTGATEDRSGASTKAINTVLSAASGGTATLNVPVGETVYIEVPANKDTDTTNDVVLASLSVDQSGELTAAANAVTVSEINGLYSFKTTASAAYTVAATAAAAGYTVATPVAAANSGVTVKGLYVSGAAAPNVIPGTDTAAVVGAAKLPTGTKVYVAMEVPKGKTPSFVVNPTGSLTGATDVTSTATNVKNAVWPATDADGKTIDYTTIDKTMNRVVYELTTTAANVSSVTVNVSTSENKLLVDKDNDTDTIDKVITVTYQVGEEPAVTGATLATGAGTTTDFDMASNVWTNLNASTLTVPYGALVTITPAADANNIIGSLKFYERDGVTTNAKLVSADEVKTYNVKKTGESWSFVMPNKSIAVRTITDASGRTVTLGQTNNMVTANDLYIVDNDGTGEIKEIIGKVTPTVGTTDGVKVANGQYVAVVANNKQATIAATAGNKTAYDNATNLAKFAKLIDTFNGNEEGTTDPTAIKVAVITASADTTVTASVSSNEITLTKLNDASYNNQYGYSVTVGETTVTAKTNEDVVAFSDTKVPVNTEVTINTTGQGTTKAVVSVYAYDTVTGGGKALDVVDKGSGKYSFVMPAGAVKVTVDFGATVNATVTNTDKTGAVKFITGTVNSSVTENNITGTPTATYVKSFEEGKATPVAKAATLQNTNVVPATNTVRAYVWAAKTATVNFTVGDTTYSTATSPAQIKTDGADFKADMQALVRDEVIAAYYAKKTSAEAQAIIDKWHDELGQYGLGIDNVNDAGGADTLATALSAYYSTGLTYPAYGGNAITDKQIVELELTDIAADTEVVISAVTQSYTATLTNVTPKLSKGETVTVTYEGMPEDFELKLTSLDAANGTVTGSIPAGALVTVTVTGDRAVSGVTYNGSNATVSKTDSKVYTFTMPAAATTIAFTLANTYKLNFTKLSGELGEENLAGIVGVYQIGTTDGKLTELADGALLESGKDLVVITDRWEFADELTDTTATTVAAGTLNFPASNALTGASKATTEYATPGGTLTAKQTETDTAIKSLLGNSETKQAFTLTTDTTARTIQALGKQSEYTLTFGASLNCTYTVKVDGTNYASSAGSATAHYGDEIVVAVKPIAGYTVKGAKLTTTSDVLPSAVSVNESTNTYTYTYTFAMPAGNRTVTVTTDTGSTIAVGSSATDAAIGAKSFYTYQQLADESYVALPVTPGTTLVARGTKVVALVEADAGKAPEFTNGTGSSLAALSASKLTDAAILNAVKTAAASNGYTGSKTTYWTFNMAAANMTVNTTSRSSQGSLHFAWTPSNAGSYTVTDGTTTVNTADANFGEMLAAYQLVNVNANTPITVKVTPKAGYAVKQIVFVSAAGSDETANVELTTVTPNAEYIFPMPDTGINYYVMRVVFDLGYKVTKGDDVMSMSGKDGASVKGVFVYNSETEAFEALAETTALPAGTKVYAVVSKPKNFTITSKTKALKNGTSVLSTDAIDYSATETTDYAKLVKLAGVTADKDTVLAYSFNMPAGDVELTVNATETTYKYTRTALSEGANLTSSALQTNTIFLYVKSYNADGSIKELGVLNKGNAANLAYGTPIYIVVNTTDANVAENETVGIKSTYDTNKVVSASVLSDAAALTAVKAQATVKTLIDGEKALQYYTFNMPMADTTLTSELATEITKVEITEVSVNTASETATVAGTRVRYANRAQITLDLAKSNGTYTVTVTDSDVTRVVSFASSVKVTVDSSAVAAADVTVAEDKASISFADPNADDITITVTDAKSGYMTSAAITAEDKGEGVLSVTSAKAAMVLVKTADGVGYEEVGYTRKVSDTEYEYKFDESTEVTVVLKGDVDLNGRVERADATKILRSTILFTNATALSALEMAVGNVDTTAGATQSDATAILRSTDLFTKPVALTWLAK